MIGVDNIGLFVKYLAIMVLVVAVISFWVAMVRDNLKRNEGYSKYVWTIFTVAVPVFGALVYFLTARRALIKQEESAE